MSYDWACAAPLSVFAASVIAGCLCLSLTEEPAIPRIVARLWLPCRDDCPRSSVGLLLGLRLGRKVKALGLCPKPQI